MEIKPVPFVDCFVLIAYSYLRALIVTLLTTRVLVAYSQFTFAAVMAQVNPKLARTQ